MSRVLVALLLTGLAVGCRGQRTPSAPLPPRALDVMRPASAEALLEPGALQPYLDAYPIGEKEIRVDLLAASRERSLHFVQTRRAIPRHHHPQRTEIAYVLAGRGTCYIGERSYPAAPGCAFRIAPGVRHSVHPDEGSTLVAITWFSPPLLEGDDRVLDP